jgi:hypothetical protein
MEKPYVPEKWKNLRLEIDNNDTDKKFIEPSIIRTESILKNKQDVFKENNKKCDYEDCYNSKIKYKCIIL